MPEELQRAVLKRLVAVGSHGMLQKHLFQRVGKRKVSVLIETMATLETAGMVMKGTSWRHSVKWGYIWTITDAGKRAYQSQLAAAS